MSTLGKELTTDLMEARERFERVAHCSFDFKRSRKGTYMNPATATKWRWFKEGFQFAKAECIK